MALARFSGLDHQRITFAFQRDGVPFTADEQARFYAALEKWRALESRLAIHGGEQDGWHLKDVLPLVTRLEPDVIVLDHLRLLAHDNLERLNECLEALHRLSQGTKYHPFVVAISTLNRDIDKDGENGPRMPRMSDLWGSSAIEHAADVAMISRKVKKLGDEGPVSVVDLFVLKNRDGPFPACISLEGNGATCHVTERHPGVEPGEHWAQREPGED